jgi:enamine deaminase RidA (YjgF/YER057c/UK114 family)
VTTPSTGIQRIASGAKWESIVGYSRAVAAGPYVEVGGTVAAGETPYAQAKGALDIIGKALNEAGVGFEDVIRTRIYVTDMSFWEEVGRAHSEVFGEVRPATSMIEITALIEPAYVVEIEATAYRGDRA